MKAKSKIAVLAIICTLALVSCDASKEVDSPDSRVNREVIGFGTTKATRAAATTTADISSMGVYCYYTANIAWESLTGVVVPNYFNNQLVVKTATNPAVWSYSPQKFWPENTAEKLSFFAYSPHSTLCDNISVSVDPSGTPLIHFSVDPVITKQTDLLRAAPMKDQSREGGAVEFTMKHALTQISFSVVFAMAEETKDYTAKVDNIVISPVLSQGTLNLLTGAWELDEEETVGYSLNIDNGKLMDIEMKTSDTEAFEPRSLIGMNSFLMMLPQNLAGDDLFLNFDITTTTKSGNATSTETQHYVFELNELGITEWVSGQAVNYLITIQGDFITTDTKLVPWITEEINGSISL